MHLSRKLLAGTIVSVAASGAIALAAVPSVWAVSAPPASPAPALSTDARFCAAEAAAVKAGATVATLRAVGDCEIDRRLATLDQLSTAISSSRTLTSTDRAALTGIVTRTRSGLTTLKATIDAETSKTALAAENRRIATDYRVYLLVAPQVHLVNAADRIAAADGVFDKVRDNLTSRIAKAKAAGKDVASAQGSLDAMNAAVARAEGLAGPIAGQVLPLTPAGYDAGTAGPVLAAARSSLVQARAQLAIARQDAKACRDALLALK